MSTILYNQDALAARARSLGTLNGIDFGLMTLDTASPPQFGVLELHFYNDQNLDALVAAANSASAMWSLVPICGGERVVAGPSSGQVHVTKLVHSATQVLQVTIAPVGDYSRYTLTIHDTGFDPVFSHIVFRFRPGCFSSNCTPLTPLKPAVAQPAIDYLAKDYDSFRHTIISAMMQHMPSWVPTSEAAQEVVLLDLFSAVADELSDYQDRVMQEAYWPTAQKRITLRRQARLMDYFIHEGNQASTVLALNFPGATTETVPAVQPPPVPPSPLLPPFPLPRLFKAWTGPDPTLPSAVSFVVASAPQYVNGIFSSLPLYTWSNAIPALAAGATRADLALSSFADAHTAVSLISAGTIPRLLVEERLNPATGLPADRNPQKRQILHLTGAKLHTDPLTGLPVVRVTWQKQDALTYNYCFSVNINGVWIPNVSLFHGNLVDMVQGQEKLFNYVPPGSPPTPGVYNFQFNLAGAAECHLPPAFPVLWQKTTPGGLQPSVSTIQVRVTDGGTEVWSEQPDLIHSESTDTHFVVETDEQLRTLVRFGDGTNGKALPGDATVTIQWLTGYGPDGNVGRDSLANFDPAGLADVALGTVWNPFDVTDGLAPETANVIRRRVPEAFLYNQSRAITLADYVARAEEVPGVASAMALYMWTGSWRTVRVVIDPEGTTTLSESLRSAVEQQLDAVHLIGEDVEVRAPEYVPLIITVSVCVSSDYWIDDVALVIEQAFSNSHTADGEEAFFNPGRWTFGQAIYASEIEGVLATIPGVEHVISIQMTRWWNQSVTSSEVLTMQPEEIVQVSNDPSRMEDGTITFTYQGGRQ